LAALSKKADGIACVKKERCGDNDGTATSKRIDFCGSENTTGYSVLNKDGCCGTEGRGHKCSGTTGTNGCFGESKAGLCNPEKEFGYIGTKDGHRIIVDKKSHCSVVGTHDCSSSAKKDDSCDSKKARSGEKPKKCCCQPALCSDKSDCSEAEEGTTGLKTTGICRYDSGSSDLDERAQNAYCNGSSSRSGEADESMVTGESLPVKKPLGSSVIAGSLNGSGVIIVRLTHLPGDNTISTIATMVDEAKFSKPRTHELVDIIASVPAIFTLTIITFAIWIAIGISVRHQNSGRAVVNAITYAISVLIVSRPCAIGLAVPMVIVISGGVAAKHGVVFKSAMAIETDARSATSSLTRQAPSLKANCLS